MTTETKPKPCPVCGKANDRLTALDGTDIAPGKGDVTICLGCGGFLIFTDNLLTQRLATAEEIRELRRSDPDQWEKAERFSRWIRMDGLKGRTV
jgi:hypothetical protein